MILMNCQQDASETSENDSYDVFGDYSQYEDDVPKADIQMAQEMARLTRLEREKVYHDIHGISEQIHETNTLIQESLHHMEAAIVSLNDVDKTAYFLALRRDAAFVQNSNFRLRFLRADRFDVTAAARRFIQHFRIKAELFGDKFLAKSITQADMTSQDLDILYNCALYFLPVKDPAGRPVIMYKGTSPDYPVASVLRKCFYIAMTCTDDEESQRKGCIFVSYMLGQQMLLSDFGRRRELNRRFAEVMSATPMRVEAMHLCIDSFLWRPIIAIFKLAATMFTRLRCREHYGNQQEVRFSLQTFGIPMDTVEVSVASSEDNANFWKKRRELEERQLSNRKIGSVVGLPNRLDILLGRGRTCYNHFGNIRLRALIEEKAERYEAASTPAKTGISGDVVLQMKANGRFLRDSGFGWVEVDDETARKKVAHAFRTLRGLKTPGRTKQDSKKRLCELECTN
eukprot:Nitzschia sp. Nitz4//scaffold72_size95085//141//1508//NITZ4_004741-RA/size95085-processed-gene-0.0-mRNA-1//1//CDS//3329557318//476//frame0